MIRAEWIGRLDSHGLDWVKKRRHLRVTGPTTMTLAEASSVALQLTDEYIQGMVFDVPVTRAPETVYVPSPELPAVLLVLTDTAVWARPGAATELSYGFLARWTGEPAEDEP